MYDSRVALEQATKEVVESPSLQVFLTWPDKAMADLMLMIVFLGARSLTRNLQRSNYISMTCDLSAEIKLVSTQLIKISTLSLTVCID